MARKLIAGEAKVYIGDKVYETTFTPSNLPVETAIIWDENGIRMTEEDDNTIQLIQNFYENRRG